MTHRRSGFCWPLALGLAVLLLLLLDHAGAGAQGPPATLTPGQEKSLAEIQQMVRDTARVYQMVRDTAGVYRDFTPFPVRAVSWLGRGDLLYMTGTQVLFPGALFTGRALFLTPTLLDSPYREAVVASALGRDLLRRPGEAWSMAEYEREVVQWALDANAKAVEILVRVKGLAERDALKAVYDRLLALHRLASAGGKLAAGRKIQPCDEIRELLGRFPQHRDWTAGLECAP